MSEKIRLVLADGESAYRNALQKTFALMPEVDLRAVCANGKEALQACEEEAPDILCCETSLDKISGIDLMKAVLSRNPETEGIFLTLSDEIATIRASLETGCLGYLLKLSTPQFIVEAVRSVDKGQAVISPQILGKVIRMHYPRPTT